MSTTPSQKQPNGSQPDFKKGLSPKTVAFTLFSLGLLIYGIARFSIGDDVRNPALVIGSKDFTESMILGEYYSQTLESAGYRVERKFNLGGTLIAHEALKRGQIDMYPEYTGTGLLDVLHRSPDQDFETSFKTLNAEYQSQWKLLWLTPSMADNRNAIVLNTNFAKKHQIETLSQLSKVAPKMVLGSIPEFEEREDGLPGLRKAYGGFKFKKVRLYANGLKYGILDDNEVQATVGFTTDGALTNARYRVLQDDRAFWPAYRVAPVIRTDILRKFPKVKGVLNTASGRMTTPILQTLNAKVDLEHQDYRKVVHDFLANKSTPLQSHQALPNTVSKHSKVAAKSRLKIVQVASTKENGNANYSAQ